MMPLLLLLLLLLAHQQAMEESSIRGHPLFVDAPLWHFWPWKSYCMGYLFLIIFP
jgi:hypothetical protein